jgi:hypothetical protein
MELQQVVRLNLEDCELCALNSATPYEMAISRLVKDKRIIFVCRQTEREERVILEGLTT